MGSLEGRIALVTGGGRGIGKAISLALANEGATIAINYRRDKESAEAWPIPKQKNCGIW